MFNQQQDPNSFYGQSNYFNNFFYFNGSFDQYQQYQQYRTYETPEEKLVRLKHELEQYKLGHEHKFDILIDYFNKELCFSENLSFFKTIKLWIKHIKLTKIYNEIESRMQHY